ncbi:MAG: hypothetical protein U0P45_00280 [Acidimicrobiales bacterium]
MSDEPPKAADVEDGSQARHDRSGERGAEEGQASDPLRAQQIEVLRKAAAYLSQANLAPKMMFPLVRELVDEGSPSR